MSEMELMLGVICVFEDTAENYVYLNCELYQSGIKS